MERSSELIKVCVRVRPLLKPYEDEEAWHASASTHSILSATPSQSLPDVSVLLKERDLRRKYADTLGPQQFVFDYVYGPEVSSQTIYQQLCRPIVHSVLSGYNGTVFMYGQTTSGKTYTMLGTPEEPGVLPCAIRDVFQNISRDLDHDYSIWVSYLEIYNEQINDLLVPGSTGLKVKDDPKTGIAVAGLKQQQVWSFDQVLILLNYGEEHRAYRETTIHEHSSRSHTLFKLFVESVGKQEGRLKYGALNLVDLAGSERLGEFEVRGQEQMGETGHINKSLFVLANVINKLAEGRNQHIPYRDSKLTRVLSQALGGNSLTAIVCTVSPAAMNFYQTLSTLRFATRAKTVRNAPQINEILDDATAAAEYRAEVLHLRSELKSSTTDLLSLEKSNSDLQRHVSSLLEQLQAAKRDCTQAQEQAQKDQARLASLERAMERQQGEHSTAHSELSEQYRVLLLRLDEEREVRAKCEKELQAYKQALTDVLSSQHGTLQSLNHIVAAAGGSPTELPKLSMALAESSYVDNVAGTMAAQVGDSSQWRQRTQSLASEYKKDLQQLQDKYNQSVKGIAQSLQPETFKQTQEAFADFPTDFSTILDDYLRSGTSSEDFADIVNERLRTQYEDLGRAVEDHFEALRSQLDTYYRGLVEKDRDRAAELTEEHYEAAEGLKEQYRDYLQRLESAYVNSLKEFKSYIRGRYRSDATPEEAGEAYLWGSGKDGRLGLGSEDNHSQPEALQEEFQLAALVCGYHHSAAISTTGALYTWGRGVFGQLGHGSTESCWLPKQVATLVEVIQVACGWNHSLALTNSGTVYSWGYGEDGQLGHGDCKDTLVPRQIEALSKVGEVACGHSHSACVATGGVAYFWGLGPDARLFIARNEPLASPKAISFPSGVKTLALGVSHSAVVTTDGCVYTAGTGSDGQLGQDELSHSEREQVPGFGPSLPADSLSCGDCYTLILTGTLHSVSGQLFSFGKGVHGRLGLGDSLSRSSPTAIPLPAVKYVSAGCRHAAAVTREGRLFVWGFNHYDQLGTGVESREVLRPTEVQIGEILSVSCGYFHTGTMVRRGD